MFRSPLFASGESTPIPVTNVAAYPTSPATTQNLLQPQSVLIIIATPISRTIRPAGAKSFSPTNAAWRAIVAISFGFLARSARRARIVSRRPPPTQKTATVTWTARKTAYQCSYQVELNAKSAATTTKVRPTAAVTSTDELRSAGLEAEKDSMTVLSRHFPDSARPDGPTLPVLKDGILQARRSNRAP